MDFHKMPSAALQHLYLARLFASDGRTDGQTDGVFNFLDRYMITTPSGSIMNLESVSASEDIIGDLNPLFPTVFMTHLQPINCFVPASHANGY